MSSSSEHEQIVRSYLEAFEKEFGLSFDEDVSLPLSVMVNDDQPLTVDLLLQEALVVLTAPVLSAQRRISSSLLGYFLQKNFPNNDVAGACIQIRPGEETFELINVIPMKVLKPEEVAAIALNQALAASKISKYCKAAQAKEQEAAQGVSSDFQDFGYFSFLNTDEKE